MTAVNSPLDILKLLDKSNCGECGERTCLAFASAVFRGWKRLDECPRLDPVVAEHYKGKAQTAEGADDDRHEPLRP